MTAARERAFDVITFDCYGTLIDWESGIADAFAGEGAPIDRARLLELYAEVEPAVEAEVFRPYREVLAETAARVAERAGIQILPGRRGFLAESLPDWRPFPDTNAALARLARSGYRLGILSNVDDDLLAATRRHLEVPIAFAVTAARVRSYKPAPAHFETARTIVGESRWLHAAQSYFHDVMPARALGIATAWVNRKGERSPDGGRADVEVRTLADLAGALGA